MVDFHSHILPGIDDGAKNLEHSVEMLTMLKEQGVDTVIATPHFYDSITKIDKFLEERNRAYNLLVNRIYRDNLSVPKVKLGAEVYLSADIVGSRDLEKLCIDGTECILIEMPRGFWFDWVYESINALIVERKFTPMIAHLERYASSKRDMKKFNKLLEQDVFVQINTDSVMNRKTWKIIKSLLKNDNAHIIASDVHDTLERRPQFDASRKKIIRRFGVDKWNVLLSNSDKLLYMNEKIQAV